MLSDEAGPSPVEAAPLVSVGSVLADGCRTSALGQSGVLDGVESAEWVVEVVAGDVVVVDVAAVEDRLAEHAALVVVAAAVQLLGVLE
jgi:hypothetical protein